MRIHCRNATFANRLELLAKNQFTIGKGYANKNISVGCTTGIGFVDKTFSNTKLYFVVIIK